MNEKELLPKTSKRNSGDVCRVETGKLVTGIYLDNSPR